VGGACPKKRHGVVFSPSHARRAKKTPPPRPPRREADRGLSLSWAPYPHPVGSPRAIPAPVSSVVTRPVPQFIPGYATRTQNAYPTPAPGLFNHGCGRRIVPHLWNALYYCRALIRLLLPLERSLSANASQSIVLNRCYPAPNRIPWKRHPSQICTFASPPSIVGRWSE
jgi:hypothetical protein